MPELMIDFITSLDGYGAAEGWPGFWGLEGPEYLGWLGEEPQGRTVLMGANTYRLMSSLVAEGEPGTEVLAGMSKIVFSSTLTEPLSWANTRLVGGDPVEAVPVLKEEAPSRCARSGASRRAARSSLRASSIASAWSSSPSSPAAPVATGSTTDTRTSPSTWSAAACSTVGSSSSSTSPACSTGHPEPRSGRPPREEER